jgi:phosphatidylglycerophosphate synthase
MPDTAADAEPRRAGRELVLELVFRPLSNALVPWLVRLRVSPPAVVLANAAAGLLAALVLWRGELLAAALLLQLKTLLDNTDGALARATGRVTLTGRYLDTVADLVVNTALFAALGHVTGRPVLAVAAFVALTLVLAVDFNVSTLYREAHGIPTVKPVSTGGRAESALARVYGVLFAPIDRGVRSLTSWRFEGRQAYDGHAVSVLANLGLTTQLAVLGLCLALGAPRAYLWVALGCVVVLVALHRRAELRVRGLARTRRAT